MIFSNCFKLKFSFLFFLFFAKTQNLLAAPNDFISYRSSCTIYIFEKDKKIHRDLYNLSIQLLKDKGHNVKEVKIGDKIPPPEKSLYYTLNKEMLGKGLFPDCYIKTKIHEMNNKRPMKNDPEIFSHFTKRKFPRVTLSGSYRCQLALKDNFVHLPYCREK